jgi:hypothetical protein
MTHYLIVYNNTQGFDVGKIHQVITGIQSLTDWWHYLPNAYIVSSVNSAKSIADIIQSNFQGLLFFVTKVDLQDTNGVLNKDAWEWISNKNKSIIKVKPVLSSLPPLPFIFPSIRTSTSPPEDLAERYRLVMEAMKRRAGKG